VPQCSSYTLTIDIYRARGKFIPPVTFHSQQFKYYIRTWKVVLPKSMWVRVDLPNLRRHETTQRRISGKENTAFDLMFIAIIAVGASRSMFWLKPQVTKAVSHCSMKLPHKAHIGVYVCVCDLCVRVCLTLAEPHYRHHRIMPARSTPSLC